MVVSIVMGVPKNGCFIMETSVEMDDLGGAPILGNLHRGNKFLTHSTFRSKNVKDEISDIFIPD